MENNKTIIAVNPFYSLGFLEPPCTVDTTVCHSTEKEIDAQRGEATCEDSNQAPDTGPHCL